MTAGLFRELTNERQLASVLGHEIGHVAALHSVKHLQRQMGTQILLEIAASHTEGAGAVLATQVAPMVANLVNLRYSRNDEYEADMVGIKYMVRAGYNPWGAVEMLKVLGEMSKDGSKLEEFFRTHPFTGNRITRAEEFIEVEYPEYNKMERDPSTKEWAQWHSLLPEKKEKKEK